MKLRYRYRFYPTPRQQTELAKLFGCCRVVWNDALAHCQESYAKGENYSGYSNLSQRFLTEAKKTVEREWLKEVSSVPLQQSLRNLHQAYSNFFQSCQGKRKGKKLNPPRFKKRNARQSAHFTKAGFSIQNNQVYLAKIGTLKVKWSRELPNEPSSVTVIKDAAGRYFLSFVVATEITPLAETHSSVGIDLGITDFATFSSGEKVKSPKPLKQRLKKLKRLQQKLSRTSKGSKRRELARKKVARLHGQVKNTRDDFLHQLTSRIIHENQVIVLEDLNVSGMSKNRKLARAISDLGWRSFRTMLEAKALMYGRELRVIDRWTPTSQTCSCCGLRGGKKSLDVREWQCLNCGAIHDRDVNASKNILVAGGHSETLNGRGGTVRPLELKAHPVEASTHRKNKFEQLSLF
jgi:putative transposase